MNNIDIKNILSSCTNSLLLYFDIIKDPELKALYSKRINICKQCTIYDNGICNSSKSRQHKKLEQTIKGCGCMMKCKAAKKENFCPAGEW